MHVKKNGLKNNKQQYKCLDCHRQFLARKRLNPDKLWWLYSEGKQTAEQLAVHFHCSRKTISRHLGKAATKHEFATPQTVNLIIDTTYFGGRFGVMVLYDGISGQALSVDEVKSETNALYFETVCKIRGKGINIQSITCDGKKGLMQMFADIPVQLCHFHQVKTVNRYLTRKPKTVAAQDLRELVLTLKSSNRHQFESALNDWFGRHKSFLNERSIHPETGKSHYTHKRLRSAYNSLKRNLDYLFAFERFAELGHPQNHQLTGRLLGDMKRKLRCHQGMKKENKVRFIKDYFSRK